MVRLDKIAGVKSLAGSTKDVVAVILTKYHGLSVKQIKGLHLALGGGVHYAIVRNKLLKFAFKEVGVGSLDEYLVSPAAIIFVEYDEDPVTAAKVISKFAKENPALVAKGDFMDGNIMDAEDVKKLVSLESHEVLLAKSAGVLKALIHRTVAVVVAPAFKTVRTVDALRERRVKAA